MKGQKGIGNKYGDKTVSVDKAKLQKDIKSGKVKDVEIVDNKRIMAEHDAAIAKARQRYNKHPSDENQQRLENAKRDRAHSKRDQEALMKGSVPKEYVRIESPGPSTAHKAAIGGAVGASVAPKNYD